MTSLLLLSLLLHIIDDTFTKRSLNYNTGGSLITLAYMCPDYKKRSENTQIRK